MYSNTAVASSNAGVLAGSVPAVKSNTCGNVSNPISGACSSFQKTPVINLLFSANGTRSEMVSPLGDIPNGTTILLVMAYSDTQRYNFCSHASHSNTSSSGSIPIAFSRAINAPERNAHIMAFGSNKALIFTEAAIG